jgi:type III restriction enzyme
VQFFFKLLNTYYIETPAGRYPPDWAVVVKNGAQIQVYFVAETKDTNILSSLHQEEQIKVLFAKAMFRTLMQGVIFKAPICNFSEL